jgi:hypothetical protein
MRVTVSRRCGDRSQPDRVAGSPEPSELGQPNRELVVVRVG